MRTALTWSGLRTSCPRQSTPRSPHTLRNHSRSLLALLLTGASLACAGSPADVERLKDDVDALRAAQEQTASDLLEVKALLERSLGPGAMAGGPNSAALRTLTVRNRAVRGAENARVTFIEYSDYACPFCAEYVRQVYPQLVREYVDSGRLRYVFKNYPIEGLHPDAFKAHVAAACAGDQGRYWEMHDRLFADQDGFQDERLVEHARAIGLDTSAFRSCVAGASHDALIRADIDEAVRGGVRGTPVFVVALTEPDDGAVTPRRVVVGAQPYEAFEAAIDAVLAEADARGMNR